MSRIIQENTQIKESNHADNNAFVFISRKHDANNLWIDWVHKNKIHWNKYQIKESDLRQKTASFTSPNYLDLTTGTYCVLITSTEHEDFGGIIISIDYDKDTGLYEYQCQDHSRAYQGKVEIINLKQTTYKILQFLITRGGIPLVGAVSKAKLKEWSRVLSGLRPAYQYEQKYYGSVINFNPMTQKNKMIIRNKSWIEIIRDLVYGSGAYIDVYFDKYGIIHIEPYHKEDLFNNGLYLTTPEIAEMTQSFDTTNIITGVVVHNSDKKLGGSYYSSRDLIGIDLTSIFGKLTASIEDPNGTTNNNTASSGKSNTNSKKATTTTKVSNPYNTKKKLVWLNSDNIKNKSSDLQFLKDIASILEKNGWKTKIVGVGSNYHTETYMGPKNGIWFCIYGGADSAVFKETCGKNSYTNKLKSLGSRTVIGMRTGVAAGRPCDIRKGGKCYKHLSRAHDDNYSGSGFNGVDYPLNMLTKGKVPIMYASSAKQMAAKFLAGGDNKEAC